MLVVVVSLHVAVCILLIMIVLLQAGKGSGMGSTLGVSSQAFLDSDSTNSVLSKATTIAAIIFMLTSLTMVWMSSRGPISVMDMNMIIKTEENEDCLNNPEKKM